MKSEASRELFAIVYQSWCPSPIATLSICLLAQMYEHATVLLTEFVNIDFTAVHVAELERLAQLFDLPIFNFARLQVLSPQQHAYLVKVWYARPPPSLHPSPLGVFFVLCVFFLILLTRERATGWVDPTPQHEMFGVRSISGNAAKHKKVVSKRKKAYKTRWSKLETSPSSRKQVLSLPKYADARCIY